MELNENDTDTSSNVFMLINQTNDNLPPLSFEMQCPICNEPVHMLNIPMHMSEEHPITYQLWLYTMMPHLFQLQQDENDTDNNSDVQIGTEPFQLENLIGMVSNSLFQDVDNMTYDELLNLCDTIGYHEVGYSEEEKETLCESCTPEEVSEIIIKCPKCTICLTDFDEPESDTESEIEIVKLKKCKHAFCKTCIYQWFDKHKKCPVCVQTQEPPSTS